MTPRDSDSIRAMAASPAAQELRARGEFDITVNGSTMTVTAEHVQVIEKPRVGWQESTDGPYSCALDLEIDSELREEGLAQEFVRVVNDRRRE
jgi:isoleucyl-tRNA synthetase